MANDKPDAEKAPKAEEHSAADSLRQCVSHSISEGIKDSHGKYSFGPWTIDKVTQDGKELGRRETDETYGKVAPGHNKTFTLTMPNGKEYFFPDGGKIAIDTKELGPNGMYRKVEHGSEEEKEINSALKAIQFDKAPSCSTQDHTVKQDENLWKIVKKDVIGADKSKNNPANAVGDGTVGKIVDKVAKDNQIQNPDQINEGQKIVLPSPYEKTK